MRFIFSEILFQRLVKDARVVVQRTMIFIFVYAYVCVRARLSDCFACKRKCSVKFGKV